MSSGIPLIRLRDVVLVAFQVDPSDDMLVGMRAQLAAEIERRGTRAVIIEVSSVATFDSYIARSIRDTSQMARLMGARTVVAGLDPGIAITLIEMGMLLDGVDTARDLESALHMVEPAHGDDIDDLFAGDGGDDATFDEDALLTPH